MQTTIVVVLIVIAALLALWTAYDIGRRGGSIKPQDNIAILAILVAIIGIVAVWPNQPAQPPPTQIAQLTPTTVPTTPLPLTQTIVPPTSTSTIRPTQPPASTPVPTPTQTPRSSGTDSPTKVPPAPDCPQGIKCYDVDFSNLDPNLWCDIPPNSRLEGGQIIIEATQDQLLELNACPTHRKPLRFVEATMSIIQASGTRGSATAGIENSLKDGSASIRLTTAGNGILKHQIKGQEQTDATFVIDSNRPQHILRVEWTGTSIRYFVDGSPLDNGIPFSGWGDWFLLSVRATKDATIRVGFDRVRWGISSP